MLAPRSASSELVGAQRLAACCSKARFHGPLARAGGRSAARSMLLESPIPRPASRAGGRSAARSMLLESPLPRPASRASGRSAARSMLLESPLHPSSTPPCTLRFRCTMDVRVSPKAGCRKRPSSVRLALEPLGLGFFKLPDRLSGCAARQLDLEFDALTWCADAIERAVQ